MNLLQALTNETIICFIEQWTKTAVAEVGTGSPYTVFCSDLYFISQPNPF